MPRGKVKLAFIANLEARRASYRKRKEGLLKKLEELSILCDIQACAIIYSPFKPNVEVWPKDDAAFQDVLNQFISKSSIDQTKKMMNPETYLQKRIDAVKKKLNKQMMANRDMMMANLLSDCLSGKVSAADLNPKDAKDLKSLVGQKLIEIDERIHLLKTGAVSVDPPSQPQPQPQPEQQQPPQGVDILAEGNYVNGYVPAMENTGGSFGIENAGWYPDWVGDLLETDLGQVPGVDDMMMPFSDIPGPSGSGASFPKTS